MTRFHRSTLPVAAVLFGLLSRPEVLACTACFGQSDSTMAKGMNMGIFVLLLVITSVLCGIAGFFVYLARRGTEVEEGDAQLARDFSENRTNA